MDLIVNKEAEPHVAHIQLNRPKALNALSPSLMSDLKKTLKMLDEDENIRVIILSGNEKAFAAGADIKQMADKTTIEMYQLDPFAAWDEIPHVKKPLIAAVSGFALGGGCELAMMCDMIIASDTARFGQPELKLGVIPGAGGTQRLTRALGKARAMEWILTGTFIDAREALQAGLINKIVPVERYLQEALKVAVQIAALPPLAVRMAKESILNAFEMPLKEGLRMERKNFYMLFDSGDQKEGMAAFIEKREAKFKGK